MSERATCWSITINNPQEADLKPSFPDNRWKLVGQMERGEEGTEHYQGMLTTPQVRFSQVKKLLPRAHIEVARNRAALAKYVKKEDTRTALVAPISNNIPTLFDYQHTIARRWNDDEFNARVKRQQDKELQQLMENQKNSVKPLADIAIEYIDYLVGVDIENGQQGVEFIAANPMWISAWKKFWRQMVARERRVQEDSENIIPPSIEEDVEVSSQLSQEGRNEEEEI